MMESALSVPTAHVHVWSSWVLVISGLTHCIKLASANAGLGTNSSLYNKSAAGPLNITDFCPGVEYLINQNNPNNTFLQANVSDCENYGLYPTARQGVLYGVCADLTTFCVLRLDFPEVIIDVKPSPCTVCLSTRAAIGLLTAFMEKTNKTVRQYPVLASIIVGLPVYMCMKITCAMAGVSVHSEMMN
ncbi:hypothetical protein ACOMHN_059866 [Nucella lapillus]